jgi:hypothetical protein
LFITPLRGKTTDWRAGCGKSACPVRSEGDPNPIESPYPYQWRGSPLYIRKQKELAIYGEDLEKLYVIENNNVISSPASGWEKTRGEKMKVSPIMLLKTNGEKMSEISLAIMLMKRRQIEAACHYILENKGS